MVESSTITFQCPNNHRITVPIKLAGKGGVCSKCGIKVVIPNSQPSDQDSTLGSAIVNDVSSLQSSSIDLLGPPVENDLVASNLACLLYTSPSPRDDT